MRLLVITMCVMHQDENLRKPQRVTRGTDLSWEIAHLKPLLSAYESLNDDIERDLATGFVGSFWPLLTADGVVA